MSTQQHVSSVEEYKRNAFFKYCNENDIKKHQTDEISMSNDLQKSGLFWCFIMKIITITLKFYESVLYICYSTHN